MKTVLIVEDSTTMARVLTYMVKQNLGIDTIVTTTLAKTTDYFEHCVDSDDHIAAIVDLDLPDAPNGEAVDYVLTQGVPVVVLTGNVDLEYRQRILKKASLTTSLKRDVTFTSTWSD